MYSFDERVLVSELAALSNPAQIAFALAAATRQLSNYERFAREFDPGNEQRPRQIVNQLWVDLRNPAVDSTAWSVRLDEVMGLLPEEEDDWEIGHALAEDALSSLAYAIRCRLTPEPQEAAWAARRAYEAADQAAIRVLGVQPGLPNSEVTILAHEFVQRELICQQTDLLALRNDLIDEVQRKALTVELLNDHEAATLAHDRF